MGVKRPKAGARSWIPKAALAFTIVFGSTVWLVLAYVRQRQLVWIPEAGLWYRIGVCMWESLYIPLVFVAVGLSSFVLLKKRQR